MPDPEFAYDVFLSFASADEEVAREVWRTLEAGGLRVFWSTASLDVAMGQSWVAAIQENLERSRHFVLFWTAQAKVSPWVQAEYETFYGQCYLKDRAGRRLVVLPDGEEPIASLPPFLRSLQVARTASEMVGRLGGGVPLSRGVASGWLGEGDRGGEGWASSWSQGADRFGEFGNFKVADALQRMRWIEPGSFRMGSPESEPGRDDVETPHEVTLTEGFWLADTPCPQSLWAAVMGSNPSRFQSPDRPVELVSWEDCQEFCRTLRAQASDPGWRLPTEAEWEYACRAGTKDATYAGPIETRGERDAPILDAIAWYGGNSGVGYDLAEAEDSSGWKEKQFEHTRAGTRRVKTKAPNAWGLYDTLGNVWEWCEDWFGPYEPGSSTDPRGPSEGSGRVIRGGSWFLNARNVRAAYRRKCVPSFRGDALGFRLARGRGLR